METSNGFSCKFCGKVVSYDNSNRTCKCPESRFKDDIVAGKVYGNLTSTGKYTIENKDRWRGEEVKSEPQLFLETICKCGRHYTSNIKSLRGGVVISCGCIQKLNVTEEERQFMLPLGYKYLTYEVTSPNYKKIKGGREIASRITCTLCKRVSRVANYRIIKGLTTRCICTRYDPQYKQRKSKNRTNPVGKFLATYKSKNKRKFGINFLPESIKEMIKQNCAICNSPPGYIEYLSLMYGESISFNGIDRIDSNIGYVEGNIRPCCGECNRIRSDYNDNEFREMITKMYNSFVLGKSNSG